MTDSEKNRFRRFWILYWHYGRSPQDWVNIILDLNPAKFSNINYKDQQQDLLLKACVKLSLETLIDESQMITLQSMIKSNNEDDLFLAVSTMAALKPNKFKKQ